MARKLEQWQQDALDRGVALEEVERRQVLADRILDRQRNLVEQAGIVATVPIAGLQYNQELFDKAQGELQRDPEGFERAGREMYEAYAEGVDYLNGGGR